MYPPTGAHRNGDLRGSASAGPPRARRLAAAGAGYFTMTSLCLNTSEPTRARTR